MKKGIDLFTLVLLASALFISVSTGLLAQWSTPQKLSVGTEDAKSLQIAGDPVEGFHTVYAWSNIVYRKWQAGTLFAPVYLNPGFCPNPQIGLAGNGHVHLTWEFWPNDGPHVGWAYSTNSGSFFNTPAQITFSSGVKFPQIEPFGASNSPDMIVSWWNASNKGLYSMRWNGSSWSSPAYIGSDGDNEYCVTGMCRSLQDGTIYRSYGKKIGGVISYCYRRYNGINWEAEVVVDSPGFFARQDIAVNPIGQILCVWEQDEKVWYRMFTPGSGWSARTNIRSNNGGANFPAVTAIPGTNDFYVTYSVGQARCYGRRWSGGGWMAEETPQGSQANDFVPDTAIAAGSDGSLMAAWEYWGDGGPRWWFSVLPGTGGGPKGTLTGVVRDQFGQGIAGATVSGGAYATITGTNGAYSMQMNPGTYTVMASKQYYTSQSVPNVTITANVTTTQDFVIQANPPGPVTAFSVVPSDTVNRLYWTNPGSGNFVGTMIRFKTTGYPTSPTDGTLLVDKSAAPGTSDNYTHTGLTNGVTYYYAAFTHDDANHYSTGVNALGTPVALTCGAVKSYPENTTVDLKAKVVSAIFSADGVIYIQDQDRTSGIRVVATNTGLAVGDLVDVTGQIATRSLAGVNSERQINSPVLTKTSTVTPPVALGMNTTLVGGVDLAPIVGVKNSKGVNNQGLLARVFGKVTYASGQYIYLDDGGKIDNLWGLSTPVVGVMVKLPASTTDYPVGSMVSAAGVIAGSVPNGWDKNRALILTRTWSDVSLLAGPQAGTISGTVLDNSSSPVSGASVTTSSGGYSATTNASGAYTIASVTPGTYNVTASKSGYSSQTQNGVVVSDGVVSTANFTLTPTQGAISGTVKDNVNNAVSGATVSTNTGGYTTTTNASGAYTLSLVNPGTYDVTASKSGYVSQTQSGVSVTAGQTATVNLAITSNVGTIAGQVKDGANNGVSGATVSTNTGGYTTTTNSTGYYTLSGVTTGTYNVTASKAGYNPATQNGVSVTAGATTTVNLTITAQPGSISGTVKDGANNAISGATVSTNVGGYTATTNASGAYTLANVSAGTYNVTASKTNYNPQTLNSIVVNPGGAATANFTLTVQPGTISGTVKDTSNNAISGATVSTNTGGYSATTDASGAYTLSNVAPGTYNVTATKPLYDSQTVTGVSVSSNANTTVNFSLVYNPFSEKIVNGNFEGSTFSFWGGTCPAPVPPWGAAWRSGTPNQYWDVVNATSYNLAGRTGKVQRMTGLASGFEAGLIYVASGLTPGAPFTFSAEAFQFDQGTNVWIAADANGGTVMPARTTHFDNITGQWNSKSVTGTVGAGGTVSCFIWAYRQWGPQADAFFDNLSLMSY